jgi:hypothetical protein
MLTLFLQNKAYSVSFIYKWFIYITYSRIWRLQCSTCIDKLKKSSASTCGHFRFTPSVWNLRWLIPGYACILLLYLLRGLNQIMEYGSHGAKWWPKEIFISSSVSIKNELPVLVVAGNILTSWGTISFSIKTLSIAVVIQYPIMWQDYHVPRTSWFMVCFKAPFWHSRGMIEEYRKRLNRVGQCHRRDAIGKFLEFKLLSLLASFNSFTFSLKIFFTLSTDMTVKTIYF